MREMTWKCKSCCKCLEVWRGFLPFSTLSLDMWITALKHTASFLVSESNCKQSEQNPMSDSLCSREALSNALSVALERSIYTVGQHSAAFREWFHNVICNKPGMKCRWDKRMSITDLLGGIMSVALHGLYKYVLTQSKLWQNVSQKKVFYIGSAPYHWPPVEKYEFI